MQVGDLVRVPQYSYVTGFVGIVTSINDLGSALVTSMCGKRSDWIYPYMKVQVLSASRRLDSRGYHPPTRQQGRGAHRYREGSGPDR